MSYPIRLDGTKSDCQNEYTSKSPYNYIPYYPTESDRISARNRQEREKQAKIIEYRTNRQLMKDIGYVMMPAQNAEDTENGLNNIKKRYKIWKYSDVDIFDNLIKDLYYKNDNI